MQTTKSNPDKPYLAKYENLTFQPIFIQGVQRSGTSILYKILNETSSFNITNAYHLIRHTELIHNYINHKEKQAKQELLKTLSQNAQQDRGIDKLTVTPDFPEEYGFLLAQKTKKSCLTEENTQYLDTLCKKIQYIAQNNQPILLKNPFDFSNFKFMYSQFPNAKFIFIHRNPLKTLNSQINATRTLLKQKSTYMSLLSPDYNKLFEKRITLAYYRFLYSDKTPLRLRSAVNNLHQQTTKLLQDIPNFSKKSYFKITYEDLCINPQKSIESIMNFLNIPINNNPDYPKLIAPRKTKWLDEIAKNKERILQKFQPYLDYCGFSHDSLMQV